MKKILAVLLLLATVFCLAACKEEPTTPGNGLTPGTPPTFKYLYNNDSGHQAVGEYLQAALATAGLTVQLENQEWATFLNTRKDGNYMVARNGWLADYADPISFLDMWTSDSGNNDAQLGKGEHASVAMYNLDLTSYGYDINVQNGTWAQTYDVLIKTIKSCTDNAKRYQLMHLAEDMIMDTGCIVPLYYYTDLFMINQSVQGFYANPLGYKYFQGTTVNGSGATITVCLASEPDTLDPALNSAVDGATMLAHLFQGLAKWSPKADGTLEIVADAAVSLPEGTVNADGTVTYVYTLRDGLKWSNGVDVKASDFEYAWKRAASSALGADYGYMFDVVKGYGEADVDDLAPLAVVADDAAKTITVTLNNSVAYWNELLAFPTYYPVYRDAVQADTWAREPGTYVCNGPYTMTSWEHNSMITLTKNPNFVDANKVTMNEIKCALSDDDNTMLSNFKNGTWLFIDSVPNNEIPALKRDYPNECKVEGQIGTYYINFNVNVNLLPDTIQLTGAEKEAANAEIRKALGLIIDRNYICNDITKAGQVPASSFVPMGMKDTDGNEFYKNAGNSNEYDGYYNIADTDEVYAANCAKAAEILSKYYVLNIQQ